MEAGIGPEVTLPVSLAKFLETMYIYAVDDSYYDFTNG